MKFVETEKDDGSVPFKEVPVGAMFRHRPNESCFIKVKMVTENAFKSLGEDGMIMNTHDNARCTILNPNPIVQY